MCTKERRLCSVGYILTESEDRTKNTGSFSRSVAIFITVQVPRGRGRKHRLNETDEGYSAAANHHIILYVVYDGN